MSLTDALGTDAIDVTDLDVTDLEGIHPGVGLTALENGYVLIENPTLREQLEEYENSYPEDEETHEERMPRFDSLLSRLEGRV